MPIQDLKLMFTSDTKNCPDKDTKYLIYLALDQCIIIWSFIKCGPGQYSVHKHGFGLWPFDLWWPWKLGYINQILISSSHSGKFHEIWIRHCCSVTYTRYRKQQITFMTSVTQISKLVTSKFKRLWGESPYQIWSWYFYPLWKSPLPQILHIWPWRPREFGPVRQHRITLFEVTKSQCWKISSNLCQ